MSPRLPSCTPTEFERVLRKLGFVEDRQRGSHKVFVRASDVGLTIDGFQKLL
jgi:predicted RNA binding protein YcfA (HicA-like mRNA interferase family)